MSIGGFGHPCQRDCVGTRWRLAADWWTRRKGCARACQLLAVWLVSCREEANFARSGHTALILACRNGHIEFARLLVEKGADVNARDESAANCACGDAVASDLGFCIP